MRTAPGALKTYLDAGGNTTLRADLVALTLVDGSTIYRWTTWDRDLVVGGQTYRTVGTLGPLVRRGRYSQSARLSVDTLDLSLIGGAFTIGGLSLGLSAIRGYFDGARVQIDHLIMPAPGDVSLGPISSFFEGRVASVEPRGPDLSLRVKSELEALNVMLPKFLLQPSCGNTVFDVNCGLVKATYTTAATVSGSTSAAITTATAGITGKAAHYYQLGVITFTSGVLSGQTFAVAESIAGALTLALPLATLPSNGDTFSAVPGCDRKRATCATKWAASNLAQFRGYPHIPAAEGGA